MAAPMKKLFIEIKFAEKMIFVRLKNANSKSITY